MYRIKNNIYNSIYYLNSIKEYNNGFDNFNVDHKVLKDKKSPTIQRKANWVNYLAMEFSSSAAKAFSNSSEYQGIDCVVRQIPEDYRSSNE